MLQPKKTKFRKAHKGRIKGVATSATSLNYGTYGLKALEAERITARQIEAARVAMTRFMKRAGRVWVRIFPDVPVSKKPTEVRMGKGKGSPEYWACRVKPGKILFEVDGVSQNVAKEALPNASFATFCETQFGVTFPMMAKIEVNGDNRHPLYAELCKVPDHEGREAIKWNFNKFIVREDGSVERFSHRTEPSELPL